MSKKKRVRLSTKNPRYFCYQKSAIILRRLAAVILNYSMNVPVLVLSRMQVSRNYLRLSRKIPELHFAHYNVVEFWDECRKGTYKHTRVTDFRDKYVNINSHSIILSVTFGKNPETIPSHTYQCFWLSGQMPKPYLHTYQCNWPSGQIPKSYIHTHTHTHTHTSVTEFRDIYRKSTFTQYT